MKCFRYTTSARFQQVTEADVQASIDKLPADSPQRANGAAVLALAIGESVQFESGVNWERLEDDAPTFNAFICNRGRSRRCTFCSRMVSSGDGLLCDGPPKKGSRKKTCDAFMCRGCGKHVGRDRDLCPNCAAMPQAVAR